MAGYEWRGGRCDHAGKIYDPGDRAVIQVACSSCSAAPGSPCTKGVGQMRVAIPAHAKRYIDHHDAHCAGFKRKARG